MGVELCEFTQLRGQRLTTMIANLPSVEIDRDFTLDRGIRIHRWRLRWS